MNLDTTIAWDWVNSEWYLHHSKWLAKHAPEGSQRPWMERKHYFYLFGSNTHEIIDLENTKIMCHRGGASSSYRWESISKLSVSSPRDWEGYVDVTGDEKTLIRYLSKIWVTMGQCTPHIPRIRLSPATCRPKNVDLGQNPSFLAGFSRVRSNQVPKWSIVTPKIVVSD